ncbi:MULTISPECIES: phosphopantetheine-binding protein [Streptomyces]|uniref:Phosphopantetheine-binding protein n=2 Tax=Streptomyces TaxID=1883 RepID=A0ABS9JF57_9ACTN|nr:MULTISPECIES: phosphopantetheine-binding protein [Streptomyces]MCG0064174.1 phosphopantetheine-binding protein [Streptomyces tricolor]BCM72792.1 carrier protein [Streptomyces sp. EAS-AB2608]CUW33075.1 Surfactin synthase subunit 1 [Streptomyces reticuli]
MTAEDTAPEAGPPPRAPRGPDEERIAGIWSAFLRTPDPPANISFFTMGGYSLGLMRLGLRLQQEFGIVIPVPDLFEHTTIEAQAVLVRKLLSRTPGT